MKPHNVVVSSDLQVIQTRADKSHAVQGKRTMQL